MYNNLNNQLRKTFKRDKWKQFIKTESTYKDFLINDFSDVHFLSYSSIANIHDSLLGMLNTVLPDTVGNTFQLSNKMVQIVRQARVLKQLKQFDIDYESIIIMEFDIIWLNNQI